MVKVQVKFVAYGDYLHLRDDVNSPIWIRGLYDRSSRSYSLVSYDDVNHEIFRKSSAYVYLDI